MALLKQLSARDPAGRVRRLCRLCRLCWLSALLVGVAVPRVGASQAGLRGEDEVKAAFLYNFVKFVQWPPSDYRSDTVVIGVVARVAFNEALEAIVNGKTVAGRVVVVRRLRNQDDPRAAHIVFVEASEASRGADILRRVRNAGVLTVGETSQFLSEGGLVRLYVKADRVRFQIDPVGVQLEGLKISSQLLSLAR